MKRKIGKRFFKQYTFYSSRAGFEPVFVIVIIAAMIIFGSAGYLYLKKIENKQANPLAVAPTSSVQLTAPSSTIDISDWKTYRNEKYGFEVKYPPDWIVRSNDRGLTVTTLFDPALLNEGTVQNFAFFNVELVRPRPGTLPGPANPDGLPIDQWFAQYSSRGFPASPTITMVQVAGRSAIRLEIAEADGNHAYIYVPNGYDVVEISFRSSSAFASTYDLMLNELTF